MKIQVVLMLCLTSLFISCGDDMQKKSTMTDCKNVDEVIVSVDVIAAPCGESKGKIQVVTTLSSLEYSIDGTNFQNSGVFEDLIPNQYNLTIKNEDCMWTKEIIVRSGISLADEVGGIIESHCAIAGCHVTGVQSPDLTMKSNILSAASRMEGNITGNLMPPPNSSGPKLSQTDKEKLLCWISDGAKDN